MSRQLSQQEIDAAFQNLQGRKREAPAVKFDFRRPDRIPKSQVRAIHFARHLCAQPGFKPFGVSALYLTVNLVSVGSFVRRISGRIALAHLHRFARTQPL